MYLDAFEEGINKLLITCIIGITISFISLCYAGYKVYENIWGHETFESHKKLVPNIKLHTDGKVIDTIYVYELKK